MFENHEAYLVWLSWHLESVIRQQGAPGWWWSHTGAGKDMATPGMILDPEMSQSS